MSRPNIEPERLIGALVLPPEDHDRISIGKVVALAPPNTKTLTQRYYERVVYNPHRYSDLTYMDAHAFLKKRWNWADILKWQLSRGIRIRRTDHRSSELAKVIPLLRQALK